MEVKTSNTLEIKEAIKKKAPHFLPAILIALNVGCAQQKQKEESKLIPEKIVLGGETEGKVALIINGKIASYKQIPGVVFHQVMFSKDGRYIFAAAQSHNKVYVFDGETLELIKSIDVGKHPSHMDTDDSGRVVAVVNEDSNDVSFISTENLEEIARIPGFSTPHFARYYNGFWFVANFSDNRISVADLHKQKIETEIKLENIPPCKVGEMPEECAFFDVSINKEIGMGLASHTKTGTVLIFDAKNLKIDRIIGKDNDKLAPVYSKLGEEKGAFKPNAHHFGGSIGYVVFRKGVIGYNFVARDIWWVWEHPDDFFSQFGIEYPNKFFVIMHDKRKIAILSSKGFLENLIEIDEIPEEGIYHNHYVYLFAQGNGYTRIYGLDGNGRKYLISEIDFADAEGIHIPGATPHCH